MPDTPQVGNSLSLFVPFYILLGLFCPVSLVIDPILTNCAFHRLFIRLSLAMAPSTSGETSDKPIVLHIGDPVKWNTDLFAQFSKDFTVVRPSLEERQRDEFMKALKEKRWGNFSAIFRPFWNTGGEMGRWDKELIPLVPESCKIFASAGAGFDWADVDILAARGMPSSPSVSSISRN